MEIGVIGLGRLGKLAVKHLAQDFDVSVFDIRNVTEEAQSLGAKAAGLDEVCSKKVIIPFVPMSAFEGLIKEISSKITEGSLVIDVCSVKEMPSQIMQKYLPKEVSILATHPMFGPDSARDTLFGQKVVLCPVRIKDELFKEISAYLNGHGMRVIESTPEDHDKQIADTLFLTHFIGRALMTHGAKPRLIDTKGHRRLIKILETVENDTWQLFEDMYRYNNYASEAKKRFLGSLQDVAKRLGDKE